MRTAGRCIALAFGIFLMVFFGMQHLWRENYKQSQQVLKYEGIVEKRRLRIQDLEREITQLKNTIQHISTAKAKALKTPSL